MGLNDCDIINTVLFRFGLSEERLTALKALRERVESVIIVTAEHALHDRAIASW